MNWWMLVVAVLVLATAASGAVCVTGPRMKAIVAYQLASALGALALLALAVATGRDPLGDLAIVLAALSFPGTIFFVRYMEEPE